MKQQLNVRVSKATRKKIDFLTNELYGTQTETIAVAIDRLYQARKAIEQHLPIWQYLLSKGEKEMATNQLEWHEDQALRTRIPADLLIALRDADGVMPVYAEEVCQSIETGQIQALIDDISAGLDEAADIGF